MAATGYTLTKTIPAPPSEVFATLCDLKAVPSWRPDVLSVLEVDDKPVGAGKAWVETRRRTDGRAVVNTVRVTRCEPGRLDLAVSGPSTALALRYDVEPAGRHAKVTLHGDGRMTGPLFFLSGRLRRRLAEENAAVLDGLARHVASRPEPTGPKAAPAKAAGRAKAGKPAGAAKSNKAGPLVSLREKPASGPAPAALPAGDAKAAGPRRARRKAQ